MTINITTGLAGGKGEATYSVASQQWQDSVGCRDLWVAAAATNTDISHSTKGGDSHATYRRHFGPPAPVPVMMRLAQRGAPSSGVRGADGTSGSVAGDSFALQCLGAPLPFGCGGRVQCFLYEDFDKLSPQLALLDSPVFALPPSCYSGGTKRRGLFGQYTEVAWPVAAMATGGGLLLGAMIGLCMRCGGKGFTQGTAPSTGRGRGRKVQGKQAGNHIESSCFSCGGFCCCCSQCQADGDDGMGGSSGAVLYWGDEDG